MRVFQNLPITFDESIAMGFYYVAVGYYFLLFAYFLLIRFRKTKRVYWLFFATFFLMLALSGGFFIVHDFYVLPTDFTTRTFFWRIASFFAWLAIACMVEILAILMFTGNQNWVRLLKIGLPVLYVIIAVIIFVLPDQLICDGCPGMVENQLLKIWLNYSYAEGRFWLNAVILPVTTVLFPVLFFYLGFKSAGVIRRSSILNGLGFLLYFIGRLLQPLPIITSSEHLSIMLIPPSLILISLLILAIANQFEHLK